MKLFWKASGLPQTSQVKRARRIVFATGAEGGPVAVNILENVPISSRAKLLGGANAEDAFTSGNEVVVIQVPPGAVAAPAKLEELRAWAREVGARGMSERNR